MSDERILVAGIGNIFLGDDAFGVEVVQRLIQRPWPANVRVVDFGIRGFDLAYALLDGYDVAILIDALPRGGAPGTLYLLEPDLKELNGVEIDTHSMDPLKVLRLTQMLGGQLGRILVVGCEPATLEADEDGEIGEMALSAPVQASLDEAVRLVESLVEEICAETVALRQSQ